MGKEVQCVSRSIDSLLNVKFFGPVNKLAKLPPNSNT